MIEVTTGGRTEEFRDPYQAALYLLEQCSSVELQHLATDGLRSVKRSVFNAEAAERVAQGQPPIPEAA
jgi:hypothetical protein